jgi:hypothetical protein
MLMKKCRCNSLCILATLAWAVISLPARADEGRVPLPDPDGKSADMSKPVQVYILMGQSNMIGSGKPSVLQGIAAEKYPYLVDDAGAWTVRKDVRNVFVMCSGNSPAKDYKNEWMTISGNIGPEMGIGHYVGHVTDAPVLILKSCIGNRSLGWDLLPPGSEPYEHGGKTQPGYRGTPDDPGGDTGGDGDVAAAKKVLENLDKYYPGATEYEVKGFFWWQGDKDMRNPAHFNRYGQNLVQLIRALRKDFDAPNALFVTASLGQTKMGSTGGDGKILDAMKAVAESGHADLKGKVGFVYTHPLSKGGSSSGHYGGNPETYMNVGEAMGRAMVELLGSESSLAQLADHLDAYSRPVYRALEMKKYASAYRALKKFEEAHKAKVKDKKLDEDARAAQEKLLEAFEQEINWPIDRALAEIEGLEKAGDVYRLSLVFREHERAFKGIDKFDLGVGTLGKELRGSKMRSAIAAGKKFYAFIEKVRRWESEHKGPRSEASIKSITAYLNGFAKREKDNIYGKAAAIAAEKIADSDHAVESASSYIRLAQ